MRCIVNHGHHIVGSMDLFVAAAKQPHARQIPAWMMGNACGQALLKGFGMITISDDVINMGLRGNGGESYC